MQVALVTVGDELLSGDVVNTNAAWLAGQLTDRGASVARVLTVPDDADAIADALGEWRDEYDAVVVTGGLGGTHDDVTMDAVARAFDRDLVVDADARADVEETLDAYRERHPDVVERFPEMDIDVEAQASIPAGARVLLNPAGLAPGCVVENVYVLPGIPAEMKATFALVADEFAGDAVSATLYTPAPEGATSGVFASMQERFDVAVGSYPQSGAHNRINVTGTDRDELDRAIGWLRERIEVVDAPTSDERDGSE